MRRHRAAQAEERLRAGMLWEEPIPGLVFTTVLGRPLDGPTLTTAFQDLLARAGLPRLTYHELRHGCATLLLASGTDIAVVRDILGHSTIALTADTAPRSGGRGAARSVHRRRVPCGALMYIQHVYTIDD